MLVGARADASSEPVVQIPARKDYYIPLLHFVAKSHDLTSLLSDACSWRIGLPVPKSRLDRVKLADFIEVRKIRPANACNAFPQSEFFILSFAACADDPDAAVLRLGPGAAISVGHPDRALHIEDVADRYASFYGPLSEILGKGQVVAISDRFWFRGLCRLPNRAFHALKDTDLHEREPPVIEGEIE